MRIKHPSTFVKYDDTYNALHQLYVDALDDPNFREYVRRRAQPIWGTRVDEENGMWNYIIAITDDEETKFVDEFF